MKSVTIILKALNIIISVTEKAKIEIEKIKLNIERMKLEIEKKKVITEKKKITIKKIKLDIETIKLKVHCKLLRMIVSYIEEQKSVMKNLINLINNVNTEASCITIEMYKIIKHIQRLADYLDKNSVAVSDSSSSDEKFDNNNNSLLTLLTDISAAAVDSSLSFFFNLLTSVDSLTMSSTETLNILSEKFSDDVSDWHDGIIITRSYNKSTFFQYEYLTVGSYGRYG
ncbi:hypothetical protein BDDG_12136 [Blastomyces dermatitidis ATCC 18188]|uniref:Uncharacterized protein n=1 Tax=Ajellomyces dermatitidis (strain ATCC 18188 / CBS 674.68) TaxID=653446 RepID=A0A0J9EMZ8_AJEDA|nr:hypothetical protein BDDG_12136 [Blastomyces dermatitidis ATCC 18188]